MNRSYEALKVQGYRLLYADRGIFVINKPPGLVSQDAHGAKSMLRPYILGVCRCSCCVALLTYISLDVLSHHGITNKDYFPVHRLDKVSDSHRISLSVNWLFIIVVQDTTGCLLFARNQRTAKNISQQLQNGSMQKTYLALVQPQDPSTLASRAGRIEVPLDIDDGRVSISSNGEGKNSITEWKVLSTSVCFNHHRQ